MQEHAGARIADVCLFLALSHYLVHYVKSNMTGHALRWKADIGIIKGRACVHTVDKCKNHIQGSVVLKKLLFALCPSPFSLSCPLQSKILSRGKSCMQADQHTFLV